MDTHEQQTHTEAQTLLKLYQRVEEAVDRSTVREILREYEHYKNKAQHLDW